MWQLCNVQGRSLKVRSLLCFICWRLVKIKYVACVKPSTDRICRTWWTCWLQFLSLPLLFTSRFSCLLVCFLQCFIVRVAVILQVIHSLVDWLGISPILAPGQWCTVIHLLILALYKLFVMCVFLTSFPTCFPTSHRWTVYITNKSPKVWRNFVVFASKIQLLSKELCCKVSLCENVQRQSCSYIIPLSNAP